LLLPGNEPQFLDSPAHTAVAILSEIFRPALRRRKRKYGKVSFQKENAGLLKGDIMWHSGKLRPSSGTKIGDGMFRRNAGVIISTRINGITFSRKLNYKLVIIAYLMNAAGS